MDSSKERKWDDIADLYNRIAWTHKIQEEQADIYLWRGRLLQWISVVLLALSSSGIIWSVFNDAAWVRIVSGSLAFVSLLVAIAREMRSYELLACEHSSYAKSYLILKTQFEAILSKGSDQITWDDLNCIRCKFSQLIEHEPRTTNRAVRKAEEALGKNEFRLLSSNHDSE